MTISTHNLGMSYLDATQLLAILIKEENNISVPYADSVGIATIGIGVNLKVQQNMALVLDQLGVFSAYIGQINAGRAAAGLAQAQGQALHLTLTPPLSMIVASRATSGGNHGQTAQD